MKRALYFLWPLALIGILFGVRLLSEQDNTGGAGAKLYALHCANCHMEDGQGLRGLIPPVANADYVAKGGAELACGIVNGYEVPLVVNGREFRQPMPGNASLSPTEVTYILNYIKTAWGKQGEEVAFAEVERALEGCEP